MRPSIARANEQLDPRQQLANTPPPQSATPGLYPVSIHQMALPERIPAHIKATCLTIGGAEGSHDMRQFTETIKISEKLFLTKLGY